MKRNEFLTLWTGAALLLVLNGCAQMPKMISSEPQALVLTTDFGLKDGAVSAMRGVAYQVSSHLNVSDLTHEIPPYDIWQAAYRLKQTSPYWPAGTVFVTVVDPGVGSERKSIAVKTKSGHIFVGPDNGHLTLIADQAGLQEIRMIDESKSRRQGSEESYTFHGRDVYVYVGAQLASGNLRFEDVGPELRRPLERIPYQKPRFEQGVLMGSIPILDPNYGNVWTNLSKSEVRNRFPTTKKLKVKIMKDGKVLYQSTLPIEDTFSGVEKGRPLLYFNSLMDLSLALNQDNFAAKYKISSGPQWSISVQE